MEHRHAHHAPHTHSTKNLRLVFFLNLCFAALEFAGGLWTNSLLIISDAIHDLGDCFALGQAWFFEKYSARKSDRTYTYGYRRFSLLGAVISALLLAVSSIFILTEAVPRLLDPAMPLAEGMAVFAVIGILVNGAAVFRLKNEKGINARVVALHLLEDVLGWVAALIVSLVMLAWNVAILDPILSIIITLFILYRVVKNLKKTVDIFLQAVPDTVELNVLEEQLTEIPNVASAHHVHVWTLDGENHVLTAHIVVEDGTKEESILDIKSRVKKIVNSHHLSHSTVEIEYPSETCRMDEGASGVAR